ncbi:conserved hypothetical protein, partial [Ricinus communis]
DLQLGFRNLAFGLGDGRDEVSEIAVQRSAFPLQRVDLRRRNDALIEQAFEASELLGDERDFPPLALFLGDETVNLLPELLNAFVKLRFLPIARYLTIAKEPTLACQDSCHISIFGKREQIGRKVDILPAVALRCQTRRAGRKFVEPFADDREVGLGLGVVKPDEHLAGGDMIAILHQDRTGDPALQMLYWLYIAVDDKRAGGDDRAGNLCSGGKAAHDAEQQQNGGYHQQRQAADHSFVR